MTDLDLAGDLGVADAINSTTAPTTTKIQNLQNKTQEKLQRLNGNNNLGEQIANDVLSSNVQFRKAQLQSVIDGDSFRIQGETADSRLAGAPNIEGPAGWVDSREVAHLNTDGTPWAGDTHHKERINRQARQIGVSEDLPFADKEKVVYTRGELDKLDALYTAMGRPKNPDGTEWTPGPIEYDVVNNPLMLGDSQNPLNIPVQVADTDISSHNRRVQFLRDISGKHDLTAEQALRPGNTYIEEESNTVSSILDDFDKEMQTSDKDGYVGELVDEVQGSLYNIWARGTNAVKDSIKGTVLGDIVEGYDKVVDTDRGLFGTADKSKELQDLNTAMKYAGVKDETIKDYNDKMVTAEKAFKEGNYTKALITSLKMLPEVFAQSSGEMAAIMLPGGTLGLAAIRTKEYNDQYRENNNKGMSKSKLAETFLEQLAVLNLEKFVVKSGAKEVFKPTKRVVNKAISILKSGGEEGLQEYLEGVSQDWATQNENTKNIKDIATSDTNKFSAFLGAVMGTGAKGTGTVANTIKTAAKENDTVKEAIGNVKAKVVSDSSSDAGTTDTSAADIDNAYKNLQEIDTLDVSEIKKHLDEMPDEVKDSIYASKLSDNDISKHVQAITNGEEGVLSRHDEALVKDVYERNLKTHEAELQKALAAEKQLKDDEEKLLTGEVATKEDGTPYTAEELASMQKQTAEGLSKLEVLKADLVNTIGAIANDLEPFRNSSSAVYNNRPIKEIEKELAEVDKELSSTTEPTAEMLDKKKALQVEKLIAESGVVPLADERGVALDVGKKAINKDTQTMKVYGGFDTYGKYRMGLYQYVQALLDPNYKNKEALQSRLENFMRTQEQKLEAARVLANKWKKGDGTIEAQYGQYSDGSPAVYKYHGPQSNVGIEQIEKEVELFQKVYDIVTNNKFDGAGNIKLDSSTDTQSEFTVDEKQQGEEKNEQTERTKSDKSRTTKVKESGRETTKYTREEAELLEEVNLLAENVQKLYEDINSYGSNQTAVVKYLAAVDKVLNRYVELYPEFTTRSGKSRLTHRVNKVLKGTKYIAKAGNGTVSINNLKYPDSGKSSDVEPIENKSAEDVIEKSTHNTEAEKPITEPDTSSYKDMSSEDIEELDNQNKIDELYRELTEAGVHDLDNGLSKVKTTAKKLEYLQEMLSKTKGSTATITAEKVLEISNEQIIQDLIAASLKTLDVRIISKLKKIIGCK